MTLQKLYTLIIHLNRIGIRINEKLLQIKRFFKKYNTVNNFIFVFIRHFVTPQARFGEKLTV